MRGAGPYPRKTMKRTVTLRPNTAITPCPTCDNNTRFTAHSHRSGEDCCDVWVTCACGFDPFGPGERREDVYGGTGDSIVRACLSDWNDALANQAAA